MTAQIERLRADLKMVDQTINKVQQRGDSNRMAKLQYKRQFLAEAVTTLGATSEYADV